MKIAIASPVHPSAVGGLAAYQRELMSGLQSFSRIRGEHLSMQHLHMQPDAPGTGSLQTAHTPSRWLSHLTTRSPLLRLVSPGRHAVHHHQSWRLLVNTADILHFVGTGHEISRHPLWQIVREAEVPFTLWPAVHPENSADASLDLQPYHEAEAVFCQSDHERDHLASRGVASDRLIRCGLPPMCQSSGNGPRLRSKLGIGMRPSVLFVGRRTASKGYHALLEAWPLVLRHCPDAVLLLAGAGDAAPARLSAISPESLRDLGSPTEQEKADAYDACDVFCLPSAQESSGIVYIEAWSYGKPVICGTAPASRELVEHEVTGVWADPQPQQLAHSLLRLLLHPDQRHRLGLAGLRRQLVSFTSEEMIGRHLQAWKITAPAH